MKKTMVLTMFLAISIAVPTLFAHGREGLPPSEVFAAAPEVAAKTPGELTMGEWATLAGAVSVAKQEARYVSHAELASFVLPGSGQFMTGDYAGGAVYMGAEAAIIAGTSAAWWFLLPSGLRDASLSRSERRSIESDYRNSGDGAKLLPSMGAVGAGIVLSLVNSCLSSKSAGNTARANIASGKVTFVPQVYLTNSHFGLGMKMNIR